MLSITTRPQAPSSISVLLKDTQTLVLGVEGKHGVSTDSPTVGLVLLVIHATRHTDALSVDARTVHNNTGLSRYLDTSRRMAKYFIDHIPDDDVIPWYASRLVSPFSRHSLSLFFQGLRCTFDSSTSCRYLGSYDRNKRPLTPRSTRGQSLPGQHLGCELLHQRGRAGTHSLCSS